MCRKTRNDHCAFQMLSLWAMAIVDMQSYFGSKRGFVPCPFLGLRFRHEFRQESCHRGTARRRG